MFVYSYYSPSHEPLYRLMSDNLPLGFEMEAFAASGQVCQNNGSFNSKGWKESQQAKIEYYLQACHDNPNQIIVFSDVDVVLLESCREWLKEALGSKDIIFQVENGTAACSGFFVARTTEKLELFFKRTIEEIPLTPEMADQYAMQKLIREGFPLDFGLFDRNSVYSIRQLWNGKKPLSEFKMPICKLYDRSSIKIRSYEICPKSKKLGLLASYDLVTSKFTALRANHYTIGGVLW